MSKQTTLAALALVLVPAISVAQDKAPPPTASTPTPTTVALAMPKEETVKVTTVCLETNAAWFQRQVELTDGDVAPQEESIRRCYRIVRTAESRSAK